MIEKTIFLFIKISKFVYLSFLCFFTKGPRYLYKKIVHKFHKHNIKKSKLYKDMFLNSDEINYQKNKQFIKQPKISILTPLYNTPIDFFTDLIESLLYQTYENWELILVDASDHGDLEKKILEYNESRICYTRLSENKGIVANTNMAFALATGDYVGLLDHDDMISQGCLYQIVKAINEMDSDFIYTDEITFKKDIHKDCYQPNLKPDFSPDTLRSYNYICHFICFRRKLIKKDEFFLNKMMEGSQDYDLIFRLTERAKKIIHIPKVLYFWRAHSNSVAQDINAKPYAIKAAKLAIAEHMERINLKGNVEDNCIPTTYKINYDRKSSPLISIIIPSKDHVNDLKRCIFSIYEISTYQNFEVIIIENNSAEKKTFTFYTELQLKYNNIKIVNMNDIFNFSKIVNFGAREANGEFLLLLNNDTEVITPNWMEEMLMFAMRRDVGCVGAKLLYSDDTVQHAGIIIGLGSVAGHSHKGYHREDYGFMSRLQIAQNVSGVTGACLMVRKAYFIEVGGFDEQFGVAFNDVDFCLKMLKQGYLNIYTPFSELYHFESKTRGKENTDEKIKRFNSEIRYFEKKWGLWLKDPYYNENLTLLYENFELKLKKDYNDI